MTNEFSNEYPCVIFVPESIAECGLLCGEVSVNDSLKTKNYFIHQIRVDLPFLSQNVIGVVGKIAVGKKRVKKYDWIRLKIVNEFPFVVALFSGNVLVKRGDFQLITYNQVSFTQSELLLTVGCIDEAFDYIIDDHFKRLVYTLKSRAIRKTGNGKQPFINCILIKLLSALQLIDKLFDRLYFIIKFSTLATYISTFIKNAVWSLGLMNRRKGHTQLKIGNYVFGLVADWLGGLIIIYWFMSLVSVSDVLGVLSTQSEEIVLGLKGMVRYLMGSPADLKLNSPLNNVLGKFFLFHVDLWWAFLGYSRPLLEVGLWLFVFLGSLGLSFQLAILADLLAVASFHVYVIYVYAARLYHAQLMGLASLSRVFLGRKRNPVPGRVDSCPYSTEQLLVGTIAFTVLLFLLPTTLVYYIVFTAIRVVLLGVGGLLSWARFILAVLPLYTSALWLFDSPTTTSCIRLTPEGTGAELVLRVRPAQDSWWGTVRRSLPAHVTPPPSPRWADLAWSLVTGRLVYPL